MNETKVAEKKELTVGEKRCETNFDNELITLEDQARNLAAQDINRLEDYKQSAKSHPELAGEIGRWLSMAQTDIENALDKTLKALRAMNKK